MVSDEDLLIVEKHTVDGLDRSIRSISRGVVNEATGQMMSDCTWSKGDHSREAARLPGLIVSDLAREDVAESREGVMESL